MKKFFSYFLIINIVNFNIFAAQDSSSLATPAKVDYLLDISRLNELAPKIRDYLILLEIKNKKELMAKKKDLTKLYEEEYPDKNLDKLLIEKVQKKFSKNEINKLVAIFESKEMKKFLSSQNEILKEILSEQQGIKSKELTLKVEQLLK